MNELFHKHGLDEDSATAIELVEEFIHELKAEEKEIREKSLARIPTTNECKFSDVQMQELSDLWFVQRTIAGVNDKDRIGFAYISKALGLGDEVAQRFIKADRQAFHEVGKARLDGIQNKKTENEKVYIPLWFRNTGNPMELSIEWEKNDFRPFWEEIRNIFPDTYSDEDIDFLSQLSLEAVTHFLLQIEVPFAEDSKVLTFLYHNENHYVPPHIKEHSKRLKSRYIGLALLGHIKKKKET